TAVQPLSDCSPAIDAIPPAEDDTGETSDQRGGPRPLDGNDCASPPRNGFDIGAFEQDPNGALFGFESATAWASSAPLTLTSAHATQGRFGMAVGGSGYRTLTSTPLRTPIRSLTSKIALDAFVPGNQPNPFWLGAVQMSANCPSA